LVIIAVVAFAAGGMLADRSVLPVAGERESIRDQALVPSALRLEFVEGTWVRVTTDDQTPASPLYAGDLSRASVSELVGPDADEQHFVGRVGAAESTSNGEWYVPVRQDRRRSLNVVCDAEFRCRIDQ
jgi:hypothetical protein